MKGLRAQPELEILLNPLRAQDKVSRHLIPLDPIRNHHPLPQLVRDLDNLRATQDPDHLLLGDGMHALRRHALPQLGALPHKPALIHQRLVPDLAPETIPTPVQGKHHADVLPVRAALCKHLDRQPGRVSVGLEGFKAKAAPHGIVLVHALPEGAHLGALDVVGCVDDVDAPPLVAGRVAAEPGGAVVLVVELGDDSEAVVVEAVTEVGWVQLLWAVPLEVFDVFALQVTERGEIEGGEVGGEVVYGHDDAYCEDEWKNEEYLC